MEPRNQLNSLFPTCPIHLSNEIKFCCLTPSCNSRLLCITCSKTHNTNAKSHQVKDLGELFSDEYLGSFQMKFDNFDSNTLHTKAVVEFVQSFFNKLQIQTQEILEKIRQDVLYQINNSVEGSNLSIDAIKIELENLKEELNNSQLSSRFDKMKSYVDKHVDIDHKLTEIQKQRTNVPIIDEDEYEDCLLKIKEDVESLMVSIFKPKSQFPIAEENVEKKSQFNEAMSGIIEGVDSLMMSLFKPKENQPGREENISEKKEHLQENIPGLKIIFGKIFVNWIGKKDITTQNKQDLGTYLSYCQDAKHLKLNFGKRFIFLTKGSNTYDSDLENYFMPQILAMKDLKGLRINLTKTMITNKTLEILRQLENLKNLKKLWISFDDTPLTKSMVNDYARWQQYRLPKTKVVIRDIENNVLEF